MNKNINQLDLFIERLCMIIPLSMHSAAVSF